MLAREKGKNKKNKGRLYSEAHDEPKPLSKR